MVERAVIRCGLTSDRVAPSRTTRCRITPTPCDRLSDLQGDDPLVLTLARGDYCPKEHQQHLEFAANQPKFAVAYTQIVTIATDDHHTRQEFRASVGAEWTFLSDPGRTVQRDLDIQEYTDPEHDPMIPHTLVLKPGTGGAQHLQRVLVLGPPVLRRPLARPARGVERDRPDWDLSKPGLHEAWDAGDYTNFHGWNKQTAVDAVVPRVRMTRTPFANVDGRIAQSLVRLGAPDPGV